MSATVATGERRLVFSQDLLQACYRLLAAAVICVVLALEWPSNSCTTRRSAPPSSKCVANEWRSMYGWTALESPAAAERSPEKWGKYTIGTWIPIISEEEARRRKPDYFLVLPWAFFNEFYEREKEWRAGGGKFIVPLPDFRVVA